MNFNPCSSEQTQIQHLGLMLNKHMKQTG